MKSNRYLAVFLWLSSFFFVAGNSVLAQKVDDDKKAVLAAVHTSYVLDDKHKLAIGDKVSFSIVEDDGDPKSLIVADSGELELPYLGRFPAENQTCKELASKIKAALEKDYYYHATVIVAVDSFAHTVGKVYLAGSVRVPGVLEMLGDEDLTLSKAILRSGGFTDYADERHVRVTRKSISPASGDQNFTVDVSAVVEKGKIQQDIPLEAGDVIFVPERLVRF